MNYIQLRKELALNVVSNHLNIPHKLFLELWYEFENGIFNYLDKAQFEKRFYLSLRYRYKYLIWDRSWMTACFDASAWFHFTLDEVINNIRTYKFKDAWLKLKSKSECRCIEVLPGVSHHMGTCVYLSIFDKMVDVDLVSMANKIWHIYCFKVMEIAIGSDPIIVPNGYFRAIYRLMILATEGLEYVPRNFLLVYLLSALSLGGVAPLIGLICLALEASDDVMVRGIHWASRYNDYYSDRIKTRECYHEMSDMWHDFYFGDHYCTVLQCRIRMESYSKFPRELLRYFDDHYNKLRILETQSIDENDLITELRLGHFR